MKPLKLWGPRAATEGTAKATATTVASLGTRHVSVVSPRRMMLPEHPTLRNLAAPPPPTESENKPAGSANIVAKHSFEGDGF